MQPNIHLWQEKVNDTKAGCYPGETRLNVHPQNLIESLKNGGKGRQAFLWKGLFWGAMLNRKLNFQGVYNFW